MEPDGQEEYKYELLSGSSESSIWSHVLCLVPFWVNDDQRCSLKGKKFALYFFSCLKQSKQQQKISRNYFLLD